jgi:hypothetical protein
LAFFIGSIILLLFSLIDILLLLLGWNQSIIVFFIGIVGIVGIVGILESCWLIFVVGVVDVVGVIDVVDVVGDFDISDSILSASSILLVLEPFSPQVDAYFFSSLSMLPFYSVFFM